MQRNEQLLDHVIANARLKGANIESWQYSANNRVVIHVKGALPAYYFSITTAIDHLIYQYNLIGKYAFFYNNVNHLQNKEIKPKKKEPLAPENFVIQKCDNLLLNNNTDEISINMKRKIYQFIAQAYVPNKVTSEDFLLIHSILLNHYQNCRINAGHYGKKTRFKNLIRFIEKMTYNDYHDLF